MKPFLPPPLDRQPPESAAADRPVLVQAEGQLVSAVKAAPQFLSGTRLWRGFTMEILETPASEIPPRATLVRHLICTIDSPDPLRFFWRENGRERNKLVSAGDNLIRSQQELIGFRWDQAARALILGIEAATAESIASEILPQSGIQFQEFFGAPDSYIHRLMRALAADLENGCPTGPLLGESICTSLTVYSLRQYGVLHPKERNFRYGLPQNRIRWVLDYIDSRLASDLSLFELAEVACLSPHYLARLFKVSMNMTIHHYVLSQRIERAKHLLTSTNLDVLSIAEAVGFTHLSHFSQVFRRQVGSSPSAFRMGQ